MKIFIQYKSLLIIIGLLGVIACGDGKKKMRNQLVRVMRKHNWLLLIPWYWQSGRFKNR